MIEVYLNIYDKKNEKNTQKSFIGLLNYTSHLAAVLVQNRLEKSEILDISVVVVGSSLASRKAFT